MRQELKALCCLAAITCSALGADPFYLKDGDRVVFYGDSITDQRLYTVITETFVVTRYPKMDVSFVHSGWGGDKVSGGGGGPIDTRLDRDVLPFKPSVMTIMLGMNDGLYRAETEQTDLTFFQGYRHIVETMETALPGIRITAIQPSPYDDVTRQPNFPSGYNEVLVSFAKWIANYAETAGLKVADLNTEVVNVLRKANQLSPEEAQKILPDRVHPGFAGHLVMAEQLVSAWNGRSVIASVTIDASSGKPKLEEAEYARVSGLSRTNSIKWTELDDALPLPFAQWQKVSSNGPVDLVLRSSDIIQELNEEPLKVKGLKSGVYSLKVDGETIGTFNNDELSQGVNLAILDTPMTRQAKEVYDLTVLHCNIHNERWRTIQVPLADHNYSKAESALQAADGLEQEVITGRNKARQPKQHNFELVPIG